MKTSRSPFGCLTFDARRLALIALGWISSASLLGGAAPVAIDTAFLRLQLEPDTSRYELLDKRSQVTWRSDPLKARLGEVSLNVNGQPQKANLARGEVKKEDDRLLLTFRPVAALQSAALRLRIRAVGQGDTLEFSYDADGPLQVEAVRLLDDALWVTDADKGYVVVPARLGILIPADSGRAFTQRFGTFDYEGCHMEMLGVVKQASAALITWHDAYVTAEVRSSLTNQAAFGRQQVVSPSLTLRKSARSFRIQLLGSGDYVTIARAYREVAHAKGWLVNWDAKLKDHPERAQYFGAVNFKLWSTLDRRMSEDSRKEESVKVNWTFDEAARVAEHLKQDLQLDRVLFILGGWIHRGYDNQHPDILPAAPECGGDQGLAACARRVRQLGYVFCLHDNYQDIYRDSPSWDEQWIMKTADGALAKGGHWAGGRAYLTCSQKALELAQRPQNLPAIKRLTDANSYFIDTTYAAGLLECSDPKHPLTKADDMKWKQAISDYARDLFGSFGSECGREWAVPHSDFFEGLTGVSGTYFHNKELLKNLGATVVPLFEIVYRDCLAMYGKYGYDPTRAAEYVLHHLSIGRPLHHHNVPPGLYWKAPPAAPAAPLPWRPAVAELRQTGPRRFTVTYRWTLEARTTNDWRVFVHFTDDEGNIKFQNDHDPKEPTSRWRPGSVEQGPFTVTVPEGLKGTFDIRTGLFQPPRGGRAALIGAPDGDLSQGIGRLRLVADRIEFEPHPEPSRKTGPDVALFTRAHNGWAEGLHLLDRFVKNTYEILSPLHELTARAPLQQHRFLTPDRKVQRTVFGEGSEAVEVIVNASEHEYAHRSRAWDRVLLPPYGFVVEAPAYAAFCALSWNGRRYSAPACFTLRSLDGQPLDRAAQVRVFHAFGDAHLKLGGKTLEVAKEMVCEIPR